MFDIDYNKVPVPKMAPAVRRYVEHGIRPGHFLTALLRNDLRGAVTRADDDNLSTLIHWVGFVYQELPSGCHGSLDKVEEWVKIGGLDGIDKRKRREAIDTGMKQFHEEDDHGR